MSLTIEQRVIAILSDYLGVPQTKIAHKQNLENDLELDSTEFICLLVSIENFCEVNLADLRFSDIKTVKDIIEAVEARAMIAV